ncbi:MAG: protease modulator HflC [Tagaea sp.]|nr:protease modulator HflC [Azospirillum sp.]MCA3267644.1 protease modulator HflC [Azospirillum sp.]MCZ8122843.1 protease modulator HflC [Magnetospirillum sp.]
MNQVKLVALAVVLGVLAFLGLASVFTVGQAQQALVLQFGAPVRVVQQPGLQFKLPFVQNVLYFDKRLLDFDDQPREIVLGDRARVVVDVYARYRIVDPLAFFTTARNEAGMRQRLGTAVQSNMQNTFATVPLPALLTERRAELMRQITEGVVSETRSFGIEVVDVRIMRADLPPDNSNAIFARMQTERVREATSERAQGAEAAQRIRAEADRERTVVIADAQRQAAILRAQGDQEAADIYARAYGSNPEFFAFWRSLEAYRKSLSESNSTIVLSPDSDFFRYFREQRPGGAAPPRSGR